MVRIRLQNTMIMLQWDKISSYSSIFALKVISWLHIAICSSSIIPFVISEGRKERDDHLSQKKWRVCMIQESVSNLRICHVNPLHSKCTFMLCFQMQSFRSLALLGG